MEFAELESCINPVETANAGAGLYCCEHHLLVVLLENNTYFRHPREAEKHLPCQSIAIILKYAPCTLLGCVLKMAKVSEHTLKRRNQDTDK